uniref:Zinc finger MYM-type protein 1 n=2 Tax=Cacopsylla melanoneura TaxID=428564 RepID=A0A8D8TQ54_9HEMI
MDGHGHSAEAMFYSLMNFLKEMDLDIKDCRGQSYDNASNMSGKYNGLQAKIKEISPHAEYVPCFAHSFGQSAVECCKEAVNFFCFIENVYVFFSAPTHRRGLLKKKLLESGGSLPVVKQLSETRWSARADAVDSLFKSFNPILEALDNISNDVEQKPETRHKAVGLMSTMEKLETSFMLVLWNKLLQRINLTSVSLQKANLDLYTARSLVQSLADFIMDMRSDTEFLNLEKLAKELNESETYYSETHRAPKRSRKYDYSKNQDTSYDELTPGQKFKISTFFPIIDNLVSALGKRQQAYASLQNKFGVFREMKNTPNLSPDIINPL